MGTLNFSVTGYARREVPVQSTAYVTGGAFTTSTTADNVEDAAGEITLNMGDVIHVCPSEDMRIRFGGAAATSTTGHYIGSGKDYWFECTNPGKVSVIDVA